MKMQGRKQYFGKYNRDETRRRYKDRMRKSKWKVQHSATQGGKKEREGEN